MSRPIEPVYKAIGLRMRMIREALGLTQDELAKRAAPITLTGLTGLQRTSIVNIEAGRQRILLHDVERIAAALGTTPKGLLRGIWT